MFRWSALSNLPGEIAKCLFLVVSRTIFIVKQVTEENDGDAVSD
jgi:hypothetical protein